MSHKNKKQVGTEPEKKHKSKGKKRHASGGDDLDDNIAVEAEQNQGLGEAATVDFVEEPVEANEEEVQAENSKSAPVGSGPSIQEKKRQKLDKLKDKKKTDSGKAHSSDVRYHSAVEQANHMWLKFLDTHHDSLSSLELKEVLNESHFQEFTVTNRDASKISDALRELPESASFAEPVAIGEEAGSPLLLVVSPSAESAAAISEALRTASPQLCEAKSIAKLFGRRVKPESQATFLKNPIRLAVGTPHRLLKLIEMGALSSSKLKYLVLDLSRNVKQLNLFDMADTKKDFNTFFKTYLLDQVKKGGTKIVFF